MDQVASWIAASATVVAAIMTASNLGARITGWGFVFTLGAIAWCMHAMMTQQQSLLWSNGVLGLIDAIGIYRWLGRRARLEEGAQAAADKSRSGHQPLFPVLSLEGSSVLGTDGVELASIVGAMADCRTGRIEYLVLKTGGLAEDDQYRAIAWADVRCGDIFTTQLSRKELIAMPALDPADWPSHVASDTLRSLARNGRACAGTR